MNIDSGLSWTKVSGENIVISDVNSTQRLLGSKTEAPVIQCGMDDGYILSEICGVTEELQRCK